MKIKYLLLAVILVTTIFCSAGFVKAQNADNASLIAQTQTKIQLLIQQVKQLLAQPAALSVPPIIGTMHSSSSPFWTDHDFGLGNSTTPDGSPFDSFTVYLSGYNFMVLPFGPQLLNVPAGFYNNTYGPSNGFFVDSEIAHLPPSNVLASLRINTASANPATADLSWQDSSLQVSEYHIERTLEVDADDNPINFVEIAVVGSTARTYVDTTFPTDIPNAFIGYYRIRTKFTDGLFSGYSNIASTQKCGVLVKNSGAKYNVVFVADKDMEISLDAYFIDWAKGVINDGFGKIEPFKKYKKKFNFIVDLQLLDPSKMFTDQEIRSQLRCSDTITAEKTIHVLFTDSVPKYGQPLSCAGFYAYNFGLIATGVNIFPDQSVTMHEFGHAIGSLNDEYYYYGPGLGDCNYNDLPLSYVNCVKDPALSFTYDDGTGFHWYGSAPDPETIACSDQLNYYTPNEDIPVFGINSIMDWYGGTQQFNVISCGYIIAGIVGGNAKSYWPACKNMSGILKADIPPVRPSPKVMYVFKSSSSSAMTTFHIIGTGFDSKYNAVKIVSGPSKIDFNDIVNNGKLSSTAYGTDILFSVPSSKIKNGTYSLKVSSFNSNWSSAKSFYVKP